MRERGLPVGLPCSRKAHTERAEQPGQSVCSPNATHRNRWNDIRIDPLLPECAHGIGSEVNDSTSGVYPVAKNHQMRSGSNEFCLAKLPHGRKGSTRVPFRSRAMRLLEGGACKDCSFDARIWRAILTHSRLKDWMLDRPFKRTVTSQLGWIIR